MSGRLGLSALTIIVLASAAGATWTLMAREYPPGDPGDADQVSVGAALYDWNCARCHGDDLGGELAWVKAEAGVSEEDVEAIAGKLSDVAPAHDDSGSTSRLSDPVLFKIIDEGPEKVLNKTDSRMSGFHDRLAEEEIWSIIAFMKSHWPEAETD